MNALTPTQPAGFALVPTNIGDAMRLAEMMAKGKLVPQALQQSPADCLLVIEQATRWGMSPFAVAQEVSVIQGKLMHSGKIVAAAIQSSGILDGRLRYSYTGEGDNLTVTVSGTLRGEAEPRTVDVRVRDVKTGNKVWQSQPAQQLAYHGARVWARRYAPEVMLGVWSPEEMPEDTKTAEPRHVENLADAPRELPPAGSMREEAARIVEDARPVLDPSLNLKSVPARAWRRAVAKAIAAIHDEETLDGWLMGMLPTITDPDEEGEIRALVAERRAELAEVPA